jgi:hypothetical protein
MHDLRYSSRIRQSFENVLRLGLTDDNELLREVSRMGSHEGSLFQRL